MPLATGGSAEPSVKSSDFTDRAEPERADGVSPSSRGDEPATRNAGQTCRRFKRAAGVFGRLRHQLQSPKSTFPLPTNNIPLLPACLFGSSAATSENTQFSVSRTMAERRACVSRTMSSSRHWHSRPFSLSSEQQPHAGAPSAQGWGGAASSDPAGLFRALFFSAFVSSVRLPVANWDNWSG